MQQWLNSKKTTFSKGDISFVIIAVIVIGIFITGVFASFSNSNFSQGSLVNNLFGEPAKKTQQLGSLPFVTVTPPPLSQPNPTSPIPLASCASDDFCRFEKSEFTYPYTGSYSNPNDPSQVDVEAVFTSPSGKNLTVPGFYFEEYKNDVLTGNKSWKVRFAPAEIGAYTYTVTIKDSGGTKPLGNGSFTVSSSLSHGFVRAVGYHLQFDDGTPFFPLGINAPGFHKISGHEGQWSWGDGTAGVDELYKQMTASGLNYFHLWSCSWNQGTPQPYARPNIGCDSGGPIPQMNQADSALMDYMVDQAHAKNIYLMPVLKFHSPTWDQPADPIKSRYFIARWGYATNVMAWDWGKENAVDPAANHAWAAYVDGIDPYKHLRSTTEWNHYPTLSPQRLQIYTQIFSDPLMTLVQTHDYTADCTTDEVVSDPGFQLFYYKLDPAGNDPRDFHNFNKPSFIGETGVHNTNGCSDQNSSGQSPLYDTDHGGLMIKSEIWGTLMGSSGGYAPWFYSIDPHGAWSQFAPFKAIHAFTTALPVVPDDANLFTTYNTSSQATTSDPKLRLMGRKNATFAMFTVQNTTGTALRILHGQTPTPLSGSITLKNMQGNFTVKWFDTDSGANVKTESVPATNGNLTLTLPQTITQNIAAIASL